MNFVWCAGKFLKTQLNPRERCPLRVQDSGVNFIMLHLEFFLNISSYTYTIRGYTLSRKDIDSGGHGLPGPAYFLRHPEFLAGSAGVRKKNARMKTDPRPKAQGPRLIIKMLTKFFYLLKSGCNFSPITLRCFFMGDNFENKKSISA